MFKKIDDRRGAEIGLSGAYADLPEFQIVNDAKSLLALLTARMATMEYGRQRHRYRSAPLWPEIVAQQLRFYQQASDVRGDPRKAARLSDDLELFHRQVLEPFVVANQDSGK